MRELDRVLGVIKALLAKTKERGATEAEAMAAALKAQELIAKYNIDMATSGEKPLGVIVKHFTEMPDEKFIFARTIFGGICEFCEVTAVIAHIDSYEDIPKNNYLTIIGFESDAELAVYLLKALFAHTAAGANVYFSQSPPNEWRDLVKWCHQRFDYFSEWEKNFLSNMLNWRSEPREKQMNKILEVSRKAKRFNPSKPAILNYIIECAKSIDRKLHEMTWARKYRATPQQALSVKNKMEEVKKKKKEIYPHLVDWANVTLETNNVTSSAGAEHGAKANFGRPVEQKPTALLGRKK